MRKIAFSVAVVSLLAAGPVLAQQQQSGQSPDAMKERIYTSLDANKDNMITKEEFMTQAEERYGQFLSHLDTNKDGVVTRDEFMASQGQPGQQQGGQAQQGRK